MDFLSRARDWGHQVPESVFLAGMDAIHTMVLEGYEDVFARAYGLYVLSRNGWGDPYDLIYAADSLERFGTGGVSGALPAASFANLGGVERAQALVAGFDALGKEPLDYRFYRSDLRDLALAVTVIVKSGLQSPASLPGDYERLGREFGHQHWTSTQKEAWLVRAAHAAQGGDMVHVALNGEPQSVEGPWQQQITWPPAEGYALLRNEGNETLFATIGSSGYPLADPEPQANGFIIWRSVYDRNGVELDTSSVMQNDLVVIVVAGRVTDNLDHDAMVVDPLPESGGPALPSAPDGVLLARTDELPPFPRRFDRTPASEGPQLAFPVDGSTLRLTRRENTPEDVALRADGGAMPYLWLVNGIPVDSNRIGDASWTPDGEGFVSVSVTDAEGRSASAQIFVDLMGA